MTKLSVNVNKIAVLRNSRGGETPDVRAVAATCLAAGAHGITVHPRPDQRHVRPDDVRTIAALLDRRHEFNIEGNGFAPPRGGYAGSAATGRGSSSWSDCAGGCPISRSCCRRPMRTSHSSKRPWP